MKILLFFGTVVYCFLGKNTNFFLKLGGICVYKLPFASCCFCDMLVFELSIATPSAVKSFFLPLVQTCVEHFSSELYTVRFFFFFLPTFHVYSWFCEYVQEELQSVSGLL